jgi:hypothetical protein
VFVADSGAGRVIKVSSDKADESTDVITDFPVPAEGGEQAGAGNPLRLLFLDRQRLVAGLSGITPEVRLYDLADADRAISANEAKQRVTVELNDDAHRFTADGCRALARTRGNDAVSDMLIVAAASLAEPLWTIPVRGGTLDTMTQFEMDSSAAVGVPTALTVSDQGYVVVAVDGSRSTKIQLMFLNPTNGQNVMRMHTELTGLVGLAYNPKSGNLYAAGSAYGTSDDEGVFRIDDANKPRDQFSTPRAAEVKVAEVHRPTALAFGPDGALYVTASGEPGDGDLNHGVLLKLTGEL